MLADQGETKLAVAERVLELPDANKWRALGAELWHLRGVPSPGCTRRMAYGAPPTLRRTPPLDARPS